MNNTLHLNLTSCLLLHLYKVELLDSISPPVHPSSTQNVTNNKIIELQMNFTKDIGYVFSKQNLPCLFSFFTKEIKRVHPFGSGLINKCSFCSTYPKKGSRIQEGCCYRVANKPFAVETCLVSFCTTVM